MRFPCDVAIRKTATFVAFSHCARRNPDRTGIGLCRIAISRRDRSLALELPVFVKLNNPNGISADIDIAGFIERAAFLPDGAAELPVPLRDFLAP